VLRLSIQPIPMLVWAGVIELNLLCHHPVSCTQHCFKGGTAVDSVVGLFRQAP
jgi:hypothetical protein